MFISDLNIFIRIYLYEHTMHRQLVQTMKVKRFTGQLTKAGQRGKTRGQHTLFCCVVSFDVNNTQRACTQK